MTVSVVIGGDGRVVSAQNSSSTLADGEVMAVDLGGGDLGSAFEIGLGRRMGSITVQTHP